MKGPPPRLNTADAIASICESAQGGTRVLGVDGFTVVPEGFRADLDLMFDVSDEMTAQQAAAESVEFIEKHSRSDVVWEVWTDD